MDAYVIKSRRSGRYLTPEDKTTSWTPDIAMARVFPTMEEAKNEVWDDVEEIVTCPSTERNTP